RKQSEVLGILKIDVPGLGRRVGEIERVGEGRDQRVQFAEQRRHHLFAVEPKAAKLPEARRGTGGGRPDHGEPLRAAWLKTSTIMACFKKLARLWLGSSTGR